MYSVFSLRLAGAALLLSAGIPAVAADSSEATSNAQAASAAGAAAAATPAKAAKPADGKICKMMATTGTRVAKKAQKVCMTAKQWRETEY